MKTYQFVGFMILGLIVAGALLVGKRKKCGCGGHGGAVTVPVTEDAATV